MTFTLMELPYSVDALEPHMSRETLEYHHGKHHKKYVDTLNSLTADRDIARKSLPEVVLEAAFEPDGGKIFNNAAQVWNHDMFWLSMAPGAGGEPGEGPLRNRIDEAFGSYGKFHDEFVAAATGQFGSGWAWLVADGDELSIVTTPNAVPPFVDGRQALLACDLWEHAYYIDHRNDREGFVKSFLDDLANWEFVERSLASEGPSTLAAERADKEAVKRFVATGEIQKKAA